MDQKIAMVYKSKTGYVKKYAQWIAQVLKCDLIENNKLTIKDIQDYDTIIYGGGMYAEKINGIKLITDYYQALKDKHLIVFATGLASGNSGYADKIWNTHFNEEQKQHIATFYLRGGFNLAKLGVGDKVKMKMFREIVKKKQDMGDELKEMLAAFEKPVDYTNIKNIKPVIELVRSYEK